MPRRMLDLGSKARDNGDSRKHAPGLKDPNVYVVFWNPTYPKPTYCMSRKHSGSSAYLTLHRPSQPPSRRDH